MANYKASLKKPFLDFKLLLIGILISILPIVRWIAKGYFLEASGLTKSKIPLGKLPSWNDYGSLFFKGLFVTLIKIIYFLPAIILLLAGAFPLISRFLSTVFNNLSELGLGQLLIEDITKEVLTFLGSLWGYIINAPYLVIIVVFLIILALYLFPLAVLNYVKEDRFANAFNLKLIFKKAFTGRYFAARVFVALIFVVLSLLLNWIKILGPATVFYITGVISYSLFGQVYKGI